VADREDEGTAPQEEPARPPLDEEAAWAALIAGYDRVPEPGTEAWPESENVPAPRPGTGTAEGPGASRGDLPGDGDGDGNSDAEPEGDAAAGPGRPTLPASNRSIVIHPVIQGPRDFELADDDEDAHYVPPEPPPLPDADVTTKFAWIAVLGGPLLMLGFVLFQIELTWWAITLGVGGFLGGFSTLVARMRTGEDDDDLPGGGAVV
jgi:hypothetical protein